jgi:hypothetical protein
MEAEKVSDEIEPFRAETDLKRWTLFPLTDAVWAMFYYTQLYICAFSFVSGSIRAPLIDSKHMWKERRCERMKSTRSSKNSIKQADRLPTYLDHHLACSPEEQLQVPTHATSCNATTPLGPCCEYAWTTSFPEVLSRIFLPGTSCGLPTPLLCC